MTVGHFYEQKNKVICKHTMRGLPERSRGTNVFSDFRAHEIIYQQNIANEYHGIKDIVNVSNSGVLNGIILMQQCIQK
jgi:hypothetical protein